ncbi:MAG TPA: hypothetical protein VF618_19075 [Thermoanaerobaculia bacterium]
MTERLPVRLARANAYLRMAGAFPAWVLPVLVALAAYAAFVVRSGGESRDALFIAGLLLPFAAGTGLISLAREGRLDLLFGRGVSRMEAWGAAATRTLILPIAVIALLSPLCVEGATLLTPLRIAAALFIPGAICFASGLVQPRYALAVVWFACRAVFLVSDAGRGVYLRVVSPETAGPASPSDSLIAMFAVPEVVMFSALSTLTIIAGVATAALVLIASAMMMIRSDFGGHRAA